MEIVLNLPSPDIYIREKASSRGKGNRLALPGMETHYQGISPVFQMGGVVIPQTRCGNTPDEVLPQIPSKCTFTELYVLTNIAVSQCKPSSSTIAMNSE